MSRKRAMSSDRARYVRQLGHEDAKDFAIRLGIGQEFNSDPQAKKDIIDQNGFSYSVKSGQKKWQIFLYSRNRFKDNTEFKATQFSDLFLRCIDAFPPTFEEYKNNKKESKLKLQKPIREISEKLQDKVMLEFFLSKAMFNNNEVDFLVVKDHNDFYIFDSKDVVKTFVNNFSVTTSKARRIGEYDDQKVVFKCFNVSIGEIEMRTDSKVHYKEVKFWLNKPLTLKLLMENIPLLDKNDTTKIYLHAKLEEKDVRKKRRIEALRHQLKK